MYNLAFTILLAEKTFQSSQPDSVLISEHDSFLKSIWPATLRLRASLFQKMTQKFHLQARFHPILSALTSPVYAAELVLQAIWRKEVHYLPSHCPKVYLILRHMPESCMRSALYHLKDSKKLQGWNRISQ